MISSAELAENRPSVVDAMQACEKNSSAKEDSAHNMRLLPEGYQPGPHDVLCGRGRKCFNHAGNVKFRAIVQSFLPQYSKAVAKLEKSYILSDVVEQVRKNSGEGGFIKKDPDSGRWYEVGDFLAREKTSQAFRDVLHDKYKSSNTAKKKRRQEEQAEKLFRAHSSRSLGASSLDASSVHSVGSSTTGDYMLSDSKLMRMERSDSILNLGEAEDDNQHDDLLGGLDQEIANYGAGRSRNVPRQRSLRSVLDFDTNRRAALSGSKNGGTSFYNRSSCPNLFAPPQRTHSGSAPPISQIEIIQEESAPGHGSGLGNSLGNLHNSFGNGVGLQPDTLESSNLNDLDSYGTNATADTLPSTSSGAAQQQQQQQQQQQTWFHHSQPNLFGEAPPVNPQGGQRRGFARQPPNRMMRRTPRSNSANSGLMGVQQQIGNLGLNDSNHGKPFAASSTDSQGPGDDGGRSTFLPQGLQQAHNLDVAAQLGNAAQMSPAMSPALSPSGNKKTEGNSQKDSDSDLMARLAALENSGFGMDVIDENPFEPVPLREG